MRWPFGFLFFLLCINPIAQADDLSGDDQPLQLAGRSHLHGVSLGLDGADRSFSLREKVFHVGVAFTAPGPLRASESTYEYEGAVADRALATIPAQESTTIQRCWSGKVMVDDALTGANQSEIGRVAGIALILVLAVVGLIFYMRRLIHEREVAEQALNEQLDLMRVLIDALPHPIYVRDRQTRMLLCNRRYLEATGSTREGIIGTRPSDVSDAEPDCAALLEQRYMQVMDGNRELLTDRQITLHGGEAITASYWILPFRDNSGEAKGIIAGWVDISERERLLVELKNAKQDAENANLALATMGREIRTPMSAVVGMLELAMKKADQGILDRFAIEVASGAARGLQERVDAILDVVRIESGHLTLTPQRAAFKELVVSVVRVFEGLARQKQLSLVVAFDEKANQDVLIDPLRFKQILSNLLGNAIKFTTVGQVQISIEVTDSVDNESMAIRMLVCDTGTGISDADQHKLFVPFSQAGQSDAGGSGLGLSISRKLCAMMQGELNLTSKLGQGTQAEVVLQLTVLAPMLASRAGPELAEADQPPLRVLVVDDYPASRLLLSQQLSHLGHSVRDEPDGAHGLRAWRSGHFDVVITDCNMPVMTGYELARAIRSQEATSATAPCLILGFTANAQAEEKDRCREAGMNDCLFKPINMKALAEHLAGLKSVPGEATGTDASTSLFDDIELSSLEQLANGDSALVASLLQDLATSNEEDLLRLIKLFTEHDLTGLSDLSHRVKGGARIIKAHRLIQCCVQLQADCNGHDAIRLTQSVDALHGAMEALAQRLEQLRRGA